MIACQTVHATIGEYQRNYIYKVFIESVPTIVQADYPNASVFSGLVDLYNSKAVFPNRKTEAIKIPWAGEFFEIPGVDGSTRDAELEFYEDEPMWVYDFFSALKDLTGNEFNQAGVYGVLAKFNMGIAKVSVDKQTITNYRRLVGVRVYGVDSDDVDKGGSDVSKLKIGIHWDRNVNVKEKRGLTI